MALPHVLQYYRVRIPSMTLCGDAQLQALAKAGAIEYRCLQEDDLQDSDLDWADIALLPRLDSRYQQTLAERLRRNGKVLLYMIDDDLLHVPAGMTSAPYYNLPATQRHIRSMLGMSHALISPSLRLLEMLGQEGQERVFLEEPALLQAPFRPHVPGEPVTIGFAGSLDRSADADGALYTALTRIRSDYGERVRFAFFGAKPDFAEALGAELHPFCKDYEAYLRQLADCHWDIGLAPMADTPFHACKHYIKLTEYGAMGTAGICRGLPPYDRAEAMGFPAQYVDGTAEGWERALRRWLEAPEQLEESRRAVWERVQRDFSPEKTAEALMPVLGRAMEIREAGRTTKKVPYHTRWHKALNWVWKGTNYVRIHRGHTVRDLIQRGSLRG